MWMQSPALWRMYVAWMLPGGGGKLSDAGEPLLNPLLMVMVVGGPVNGTGRGSASGGRIIPKIDCPLQKTT